MTWKRVKNVQEKSFEFNQSELFFTLHKTLIRMFLNHVLTERLE